MVKIGINAKCQCEADGCNKTVAVDLVLLGTGTFGIARNVLADRWQIGPAKDNPIGPYRCRCPEHKQLLQSVGAGVQLATPSLADH